MYLKQSINLFSLLLLLTTISYLHAQPLAESKNKTRVVLTGKILDHAKNPFLVSDALVTSEKDGNYEVEKRAKCDRNGNFKITFTTPGIHKVVFAALGAQPLYTNFPIEQGVDSIDITVSLKRYEIAKRAKEVTLYVFTNGEDIEDKSVVLKPAGDGTYTGEVTGIKDSLCYQILGSAQIDFTAGTMQDSYHLTKLFNYCSVIKKSNIKDGKVVVTYSPEKEFVKANKFNYSEVIFNYCNSHLKNTFVNEDKLNNDFEGFQKERATAFIAKMKNETSPFLRAYLVDEFFSTLGNAPGLNKPDFDYLVNELLPAEKHGVNLINSSTMMLDEMTVNEANKFAKELLAKSISYETKLIVLQYIKNNMEISTPAEFEQLKANLRKSAPNAKEFDEALADEEVKEEISPLQIGSDLPQFEIKLTDGKVVTNKDFAGKYFVLDFWATWCQPCVKEIPNFMKMFAEYGPKGLNMVSVAVNDGAENIKVFREKRYAMPWLHSIPGDKELEKLSKDFKVEFIPTVFLVSPEGKIVAMNEDLRGEKLDVTLKNIFK